MSKSTIKDVAEAAGVSPMTVSRVLNQRPDVSAKTRKRVQEVIRALGYAPNSMARSLSRGRSSTLGVVASGVEYFGPVRTLVGIEQQANELGYSLLLSLVHEAEQDDGLAFLTSLLAHQVDGIIWAVPEVGNHRDRLCQRVQEIDVPVVFLSARPRPGIASVSVDNYAGVRRLMAHLLEQGRRRIGIITGPRGWWEAEQREQAWRDALQEAGIQELDDLRVEGDWSPLSGEVGMTRLLAQAPGMDALFACNDHMALGALAVMRRAGLRAPEDIAVVGFDNIPGAAHFYPPLTSVKQGLSAIGATAVQMLKRILEARESEEVFQPEVEWVQPQLVIRESSSPVENGGG